MANLEDMLKDSGIPASGLALLRLDEADQQRQRELNAQRVAQLRSQAQEPLVNPFMAAMSGLAAAGPEENIWGGAGRAATQAMMENAKNRQALNMKADELAATEPRSDMAEKMAPALLRGMTGRMGSMGKLPNGNEFIKSGDRVYEIIPKKDAPEGYVLREIISAGKTILGADTQANLAAQHVDKLTKMFEDGGAFEGWTPEQVEEWKRTTFDSVLDHLNSKVSGVPGVTPSPFPSANQRGIVPPTPPAPAVTASVVTPPQKAPSPAGFQVPPAAQQSRDQGALAIKQKELDDMVTLRDSMDPSDPRRTEINRNIALIRKEEPKLIIKSGRDRKQSEGYGAAEGKGLYEERKGWSEVHGKAAGLETELTKVREIYAANPDIASGAFAPVFKNIKSGLSSFGIDAGESGRLEDVIESVVSKMALQARTADGTNLMPGSMTDFEQKILRAMQPILSASPMGRLQMIDFMVELTRSNRRMAEAATAYEKQHGRLDQGWTAVKERKAREEMARLAILNRRIMVQYQGKGATR